MEKILDTFADMEHQISTIKDYVSDIIDIASLPGNSKQVTDLLKFSCQKINDRIDTCEKHCKEINTDFDLIVLEKIDTPQSKEINMVQHPKQDGLKTAHTDISLRPHTSAKNPEKKINLDKLQLPPVVEQQYQIMRELYNLTDTDSRYIDFSGIYPRLNYLQESSANEIRYWYDFGAINTIYMSSPDFPEISLLPSWIKEGVKDCYFNNPTILPKDILVLKFLSAGPDFHKDERYPAYHFIQLGKVDSFNILSDSQRKEFSRFQENDIHYRRAIGIRIVLQGLEAAFKKGFRTYGGKTLFSSIMISPAKVSPSSAINYLKTKIRYLDSGMIKSSPEALQRLCHLRRHDKGTCPVCSPQKTKMDDNSTSTM